jgi:hypothetical protein
MVFFNLSCTLSTLLGSTSAFVPLVLGVSHLVLSLRSVLIYNLQGMTLGFILFSSYNLAFGVLFLSTLWADKMQVEEHPKFERKTDYYYNVQTAVLFADILPQLVFGLIVFYYPDAMFQLLPSDILPTWVQKEEMIVITNAWYVTLFLNTYNYKLVDADQCGG